MQVKLLTSTPDALRTAFTAIRTCYSPNGQGHIWNDYDNYVANNNDHIRLVKQIVNHGHTSTLEHISFTFAIEGASRSMLAQLTRHRVGFSYSVQSQRYVNMAKNGGIDYVIPPSLIGKDKFHEAVFIKAMMDAQATYNVLVASGIKPEDARYVLPNAATTNITISFNLRAFLDFYSKRNSETHAQWEIAELADLLKDKMIEKEPWINELI